MSSVTLLQHVPSYTRLTLLDIVRCLSEKDLNTRTSSETSSVLCEKHILLHDTDRNARVSRAPCYKNHIVRNGQQSSNEALLRLAGESTVIARD